MTRYSYNGPVAKFGKTVESWKGETMAPSIAKARSNLIFQYKKAAGLAPNTAISLPGKIKEVSQ